MNGTDSIMRNSHLWTIVKNISRYPDGSYEKVAIEEIEKLIEEHGKEMAKNEWERILSADITHRGSPAPFNPDGLAIQTQATKALTEVLHRFAKDRISELSEGEN